MTEKLSSHAVEQVDEDKEAGPKFKRDKKRRAISPSASEVDACTQSYARSKKIVDISEGRHRRCLRGGGLAA